MPTSTEQKLESLIYVLEHLSREAKRGVPIIVEGSKDLHALHKLNISGTVICIKNSGKILPDLLDAVQNKSVIVLVDFDKEGITLVKIISTYLEKMGVKVNLTFWRRLKALLKRNVKDVEGLPSYLKSLKKRVGQSS
ncbi:toprim domain-containing protein [Candidatus Bathyarchaeota archaeon]|nr:toprim domain-containing protein [Candidatus Bathyarchaeota archaeon]